MLQTLRTASGGTTLLAQVAKGQEVRHSLNQVMERAFLTFVRNAVDRYSRTANLDRISRLKLKLIEHRLISLGKALPEAQPTPEVGDVTALAQHLAAVLWAAGQATAPKQPRQGAAAGAAQRRAERLRPLQQSLEQKLDEIVLANLDSIASLGSIEVTLKGVQPGELEDWREILHDAAREIIEDYRKLGEQLREAQFYADQIGAQLATSPGAADTLGVEHQDLLHRLDAEMRRAQRHRLPLSLALLGPDHLEDIKFLVGPHAAGEVMRRYQENIAACARTYDTVASCRPHRLLWLLPGADPGQGAKALRKAQERLMSAHYHYAGRLRPLPSFSAGIVGFIPGENSARFLARAEVLAARATLTGPKHIEWEKQRADTASPAGPGAH